MYLLPADLTRRTNDASKKTVTILTAVLGSILVVGAFVMIYLLYRQIIRNKKQKATHNDGGERPPVRGQAAWHGKSEFRGSRGIVFSKRSGCGGPKLPKPAHRRQPKGTSGCRGRDTISNRTEVHESMPMQDGSMARRAYPASTSQTDPSNFRHLGGIARNAESSERYGCEWERAKISSPDRRARRETPPAEPLDIATANSLATSLDSGWQALNPPVKGRPRSSYRRPTELVSIPLAPPTLGRHSLPQPVTGKGSSVHEGKKDTLARQSATRHSQVNTGSESMFGSVDPVATAQAKNEFRRGSWELGFNTTQWPKPPVSSLKNFKSHPGGNEEENIVASASEIDSLSQRSCSPQRRREE